MFNPHPLHLLIVDYVRRNPGCCKYDCARIATRNPLRDPSKQYYLVNTCIRHNLIKAIKKSNRYYLYV